MPLRILGAIRKWLDNERHLGPIMIIPAMLVVIGLIAYPFGNALWLSMTDTQAGQEGTGNYVGFDNFVDLWEMKDFRTIIIPNTLRYTFGAVVLKLAFGMGLALLLNRPMPMKNVFRGVILLPWIVPTSLSVMAWRWMLDPDFSIINEMLINLEIIDKDILFLVKPKPALWSVMAVNIWRGTPFFAVTLLAALQVVPQEQLEAAQIDGANVVQRFMKVIVPTIMPVIVVTTMFSLVRTLGDVEIVWVLTGGGRDTHLLATYSYQLGFTATQLGRGAAASLFLFPGFLVLMFLQLRYLQNRDY
ncbi:MAG: sugar ABC transporter permease [Chloroflexi bacterium]|nr:sugar ABC transporter permease [Chloroflexota bacterium]